MNRPAVAPSLSDEAIRWLVRVRSGGATAADHAALAAWRTARPEHEDAFREAQGIWNAASGLKQDESTRLVHVAGAQVAGRAIASPPAVRRRSRGRLLPVRRWVVAAAIVLGLGFGFTMPGARDVLFSDYRAGTGAIRNLSLEDGSGITLSSGAAVDIHMDPHARRVILRSGKAYFKVARDPHGRPFEVYAAGSRITVHGTEFEVSVMRDFRAAVAVAEHAVTVMSPAREVAKVEEGERIAVNPSGSLEAILRVDRARVASWRQGRLIAENAPLSQIVSELSDYHRGWILIGDKEAEHLSVSAVLDLQDPMGSLDALAAAVPLRLRKLTPYIVILSSRAESPSD